MDSGGCSQIVTLSSGEVREKLEGREVERGEEGDGYRGCPRGRDVTDCEPNLPIWAFEGGERMRGGWGSQGEGAAGGEKGGRRE